LELPVTRSFCFLKMKKNFLIFIALACGLTASLPAQLEQPEPEAFFFREGDRAMILGDSITEQKMYSTLVESFVLSRFPGWEISFRNTGWSGDTMGLRTRNGVEAGFDRDIKPLQPTAVTIDFGMNDARAGEGGYEPYLANAATLVEKFAAIGTRVALITSSPEERYLDGQPAGSVYNLLLRKYSDGLEAFAKKKGLVFVDQLAPMIEVIEKGREAGVLSKEEGGFRMIPDGVHPQWAGHLVMATAILKGLNAPGLVSSVAIDAKSGETKAVKAKVSDLKTGEIISFTRLDDAMPWPVPAEAVLPAPIPGFTPFEDLSRYLLKVTSLPSGNYRVSVDGKDFGSYTQEQLAEGVNLTQAALTGLPEVKDLLVAIMAKNQLFFARWRTVQLFAFPDWVAAEAMEPARQAKLKDLDAQIVAAEVSVNELRKPKPHQWTVQLVP